MAGYNYNLRSVTQTGRPSLSSEFLVPARVVDVILDSSHPEFEKYGKWASIGLIKYRVLVKQQNVQRTETLPIAYPLQSHIKHIPLKNEIVLIFSSPSEELIGSATNNKNYYLDIVNLWNHPHHNAHPGRSEEAELGDDFEELADINPMRPYEGDIILEGRQGQSLRFTSAVKGKTPWTSTNNNTPLIILSNGQIKTDNGFEFITEDINKDLSSIYLTSDQKIDLTLANISSTYKPSADYQQSQLILTSGRLVFNSREEDIIFSAKSNLVAKSTNLYLQSTDLLDLESNRIEIGHGANEPAVLGNAMLSRLTAVMTQLVALSTGLASIGIPQVTAPASELLREATTFINNVPRMKSGKVYIKR